MASADRDHGKRELYLIPQRERLIRPTDPDDDPSNDDPDFDDAL